MSSTINLLLIDDERHIHTVFVASFRHDFNIFSASNQEEALKVLSEENISLVVSDYRVGAEDGLNICAAIHQLYPLVSKIMLTAYADVNMAMQAINAGTLNRIATKPWDDELLRATLLNCYDAHLLKIENNALLERLASNDRLIELLEKNKEMPN